MKKNPMKVRCIAWCVLFSMLTGGLTVRLYGLCTGTQLAQAAQNQRTYTIQAGRARGTIYDCKGRPLTNAVWRSSAVVTASPEAVGAIRAVGDEALLKRRRGRCRRWRAYRCLRCRNGTRTSRLRRT